MNKNITITWTDHTNKVHTKSIQQNQIKKEIQFLQAHLQCLTEHNAHEHFVFNTQQLLSALQKTLV